MHWETSGCARRRSSSTAGATFLPPAVTRISFLRPVMRRKPSSSSSPRSPVRNQPSPDGLGGGLGVVPVAAQTLWPLISTSPSSAIRIATPGSGWPTVPILIASGRVHRAGRGGLGQPVALEHGDPDAAEEVAEPRAERRAAGHGVLRPCRPARPAACCRPACRTAACLARSRRPGPPSCPAPRSRRSTCRRGQVEDLALAVGLRPSARRSCRSSRTPAARTA